MSTYAQRATDALHAAAAGSYQPIVQAGRALADANKAVREATDLVETMAKTVDVIVAMERLHDETDAALRLLRATLATQLQETGATRIEAAHHTVYVARKPAFLVVHDETLIPREYFIQPPPILDKRAVLSAIKEGVDIPGASKAIPNEMSLVIRAREVKP